MVWMLLHRVMVDYDDVWCLCSSRRVQRPKLLMKCYILLLVLQILYSIMRS